MEIHSENFGIIIQARSLSTRLPNKLFLPFYNQLSIIDLIIHNILNVVDRKSRVVLATSDNKADDIFDNITKKHEINLFRGSEDNVLKRFIDAAETFHINTIIRVCADNPIYDFKGTLKLLENHFVESSDYTSYMLNGGIPSIKSHLGFWGEIVSLAALKKVISLTNESVYYEHVTNFIYGHPEEFKVRLIKAPAIVYNRKDIRLTVDTIKDFTLVQKVYNELTEGGIAFSVENIVKYLDNNRDVLDEMKAQINRNRK